MLRAYVEQMLAPSLAAGDVVMMDNLPAHKVAGVQEAIRAVGASFLYLPPYSPELNPIKGHPSRSDRLGTPQQFFAKLKARLRTAAARRKDALWLAIAATLDGVSETKCRNYLAQCGYEFT